VQGQGEAERLQAAPDALIHVLQKLSGRWDVPSDPALDAAFADIERMMLSFRYEEAERAMPDGEIARELRLVVQFLPAAVDRLVRDMQLPRWRPDRRPVVLWVVVEERGERELMPVEYEYAWDRVEQVAALRGLEVAWPGLTGELRDAVDLQLLWGGYTDQLLATGADSDGVAIVAARREGPEWNVRWTFADGTTSSSWRTRDRDFALALTEGVHRLTDQVAAAQSIGPAGLGEWRTELLVAGLGSAGDYARCLTYLQELGMVDGVDLLTLRGQEARFALALNADPTYLEDSIGRDGLLAYDEAAGLYRLVR
jgi:hypothetical protein